MKLFKFNRTVEDIEIHQLFVIAVKFYNSARIVCSVIFKPLIYMLNVCWPKCSITWYRVLRMVILGHYVAEVIMFYCSRTRIYVHSFKTPNLPLSHHSSHDTAWFTAVYLTALLWFGHEIAIVIKITDSYSSVSKETN